jgi:hypothetical protein
MSKRGVIPIIDIDEELKRAQIKHLYKKLKQLLLYHNNFTDVVFNPNFY